jgi:hypothetical protein
MFFMACSVCLDVADADALGGIEVLADLTPQEDHGAAGHHGLAEVIVQLLFGIGFAGVELADAGMGHVGSGNAWFRRSAGADGGADEIDDQAAGGDATDLAGIVLGRLDFHDVHAHHAALAHQAVDQLARLQEGDAARRGATTAGMMAQSRPSASMVR